MFKFFYIGVCVFIIIACFMWAVRDILTEEYHKDDKDKDL